jgi:hypothetical protein
LQDRLVDAVMGDYRQKYGDRGAFSKWFTGSEKEPDRSDVHGKLTGKTYADMAMEQLMRGTSAKGEQPGGVVTGAPAVAAGGSTVKAPDKEQSFGDKFAEGLGKSGGMPAVQGGSSLPELPRAALFQSEPTTVGDDGQLAAKKQKLAEMLARLNKGTLVI